MPARRPRRWAATTASSAARAAALSNVARHAHAHLVDVSVDVADELVLRVEDDGIGGANPENGTGLRGLADRIAVLEGRLEIDSQTGRGTTVRAQIPCG